MQETAGDWTLTRRTDNKATSGLRGQGSATGNGGNQSDSCCCTAVLDAVDVEQPNGAVCRCPKMVFADKACHSDAHCRKRVLRRFFGKELCEKRDVVERLMVG